jgi:hypothetical protein
VKNANLMRMSEQHGVLAASDFLDASIGGNGGRSFTNASEFTIAVSVLTLRVSLRITEPELGLSTAPHEETWVAISVQDGS